MRGFLQVGFGVRLIDGQNDARLDYRLGSRAEALAVLALDLRHGCIEGFVLVHDESSSLRMR
jgi:hypothetical protein